MLAVVLATGAGTSVLADVLVLTNGGHVRGRWVNRDDRPLEKYVIETEHGARLTLEAAQVRRAVLQDPSAEGHAALGYYGKARTVRTDRYRLVLHNDGYTELYDHSAPEKETRNISDEHPDVVKELAQLISERLESE